MTRAEARALIDQLLRDAAMFRIRYNRTDREADCEECLRQLAHLHGQVARLYRALAPKPRRADDWRNG
jgi:hypothetical protein